MAQAHEETAWILNATGLTENIPNCLLMNGRMLGLLGEEKMSTVTVFRVNKKLTDPEFEELFREHYRLVYRAAFSVTGSVEDAEDVLQTIFLRLLRREFPPNLRENPKAYLYRAAFNLSLNIVRSRQRHVLTDNAERFEAASQQDAKVAEEADRHLYEAIAKLRPLAAQVLILRYVDKRSIAEIAELLGTTRGTVAVNLFRSRARLKKLIRALGEKS